ncbi:hypothetical protein GCM10027562_28890 [Arthrobacter pigmenti]
MSSAGLGWHGKVGTLDILAACQDEVKPVEGSSYGAVRKGTGDQHRETNQRLLVAILPVSRNSPCLSSQSEVLAKLLA